MIKLIYCLRKLPHLSLAEFQAHWLEQHAKFGRDNPIIRRYVQYHRLIDDPILTAMEQAGDSIVEPFDGVAVSWWDDMATLQKAMASDAVAAALEDELHFIDHSRSNACLTTERVIFEPEGHTPYVLFECLRRREDLTRQEFDARWQDHAKIGFKSKATGLLKGYIQNVTLAADAQSGLEAITSDEAWDGVTTAYFESVAKLKMLMRSPLVTKDAWEDECLFMDHKRSGFMLTKRHVIKDVTR